MKKVLALIFVLAMVASLVACGKQSATSSSTAPSAVSSEAFLADGVYTAQIDEVSAKRVGHGWADSLTVTVAGGVISDAVVESYNEAGEKKSENEGYKMEIRPSVWLPQLAEQVKNAQTADEIAGVAGATNTSGNVKLLFAAILERGVAGETIYVTVPMQDGVYTAQMDDAAMEASHGWRDTLVVTYKDGVIVDVVFESYNAAGEKKTENEGYKMEIHPSVWMPQIAEQIKNAANPEDVEGVAGATSSSDNARLLFQAILEGGKANETIDVAAPAEAE